MALRREIAYEQELNPQQLEVVRAAPGPALVIAGAGSGKTRTLIYRVAHLIEQGFAPHSLLLLTFTNKAAREMLYRVESLISGDMQKIWGGTFHRIGNRVLRVHAPRIGREPGFTILDRSDASGVLETCLQELGLNPKESLLPRAGALGELISLSRNMRIPLDELLDSRYPCFRDLAEDISRVAETYGKKKQQLNVVDFDDLLCLWLQLLQEDEPLRTFYQERFSCVLVDEYQDTNRLQADIIDCLAARHRNVMAVGDDSQSIYSFRGAHFANIMEFPRRYPDARVYKLEYNYRSSPQILTLANASIRCNLNQFEKELRPTRRQGPVPALVAPPTVAHQAGFVAAKIQELIYQGTPAEEIAVLYRAHFHCMELQMELTRRDIPFTVRSGIRFFEQAHIKDIAACLRIVLNPADEVSWRRILELLPGIGKKTSQKLFRKISAVPHPLTACAAGALRETIPKAARPYWQRIEDIVAALAGLGDDAAPADMITGVLEGGYREILRTKYSDARNRNDDIEQFLQFAGQYEALEAFLSELALLTGSEVGESGPGGSVMLSTVHQAKGLEWSVVFLLCLVEGRFPNQNNFSSPDDEEEERRLFYVGATRAKNELYLLAPAAARDRSGYLTALSPSRFLREIRTGCYTQLDPYQGMHSF